MSKDDPREDDDTVDLSQWSRPADADGGATDGEASTDEHFSDGFLRPALADVDDANETPGPGGAGRWVTQGGVLRWQEADGDDDDEGAEVPVREEARSPWAAEDVELPLAAPAATRVRAVRAWLARRRLRETELMGALLLERRRLTNPGRHDDADEDPEPPAPPENPNDPLALALTEAQAAADEYETLLALFDETRAHVGPQGALVEYYLALNDRLAALAAEPAASEGFAESVLFAEIERQPGSGDVTPSQRSVWEGRAGAAVATRKRVEYVTAAEPEDD